MALDRARAEPEHVGDLLVGFAFDQQIQHLALARRQPIDKSARTGVFQRLVADLPASGDGLVDEIDEGLVAEGFFEELERTDLESAHCYFHVGLRREYDGGQVESPTPQLFEKLKPAHAGKPDIEHETAERIWSQPVEKLRSRGVGPDGQACRLEKEAQRLAQLGIFVHDEYRRVAGRGIGAMLRGNIVRTTGQECAGVRAISILVSLESAVHRAICRLRSVSRHDPPTVVVAGFRRAASRPSTDFVGVADARNTSIG